MNFNFKNFSLRNQLIAVFAGFVVLAAVNIFITQYFQNRLLQISRQIAAAKDIQLLPSQLASACQLYLKGDADAKEKIENISSSFDVALANFGAILAREAQKPSMDSLRGNETIFAQINSRWIKTRTSLDDMLFEPQFIDTVVQESREVPVGDTLTTETTQKVISIGNPKIARASNYIQKSAREMGRLGKQLTNKQLQTYSETDDALLYASLMILGLFIVATLVLLGISYKKVFTPVYELENVAAHISRGDLSMRSAYTPDNEVGRIGRSVNKIADNLRHATAFIKAIEDGKLDETYQGLDQKNIADNSLEGALLTMRDEMKKVAQEEKERKWSTEGLAKFVDILRSTDDNVHALGDVIISNLVHYTESNQGGIYVLNEEDEDNKCLELISLYAFNTKKYDKRSYRLGEGLVGQTFLEKDTIYLLEIPHEYINITSGLGGANPKAILLVPLKVNDIIYGVVELASFNEYKAYEIEFVEKLAESIASTIDGVRNNQRTKQLLEESQSLTGQMQAQEEEMRQNMEEISATQEEMARKEVEMTAQMAAINGSLASAEFDANGLLIKANENYARALGFNHPEELTEVSFMALHAGESKDLWQELSNGVSQSGTVKKLKKSGEEIEANITYTPIKNDSGNLYKVIELVLSVGTPQTATKDRLIDDLLEVEEELRQNMEAMEMTQEQLDRKLQLTEATLHALDDVVKLIIFNTDGIVVSINEAVEALTGLDKIQIKGKNIREIIGEDILVEAENGKRSNLSIKGPSAVTKADVEIRHDVEKGLIYLIWM